MTQEIRLKNNQKVLIFSYQPSFPYNRKVEEPIEVGTVISNELSEEYKSYVGAKAFHYQIYTVIGKSGAKYRGTYMNGTLGCGSYFFRILEDQIEVLKSKINDYQKEIDKYQNKILDTENMIKEYSKKYCN